MAQTATPRAMRRDSQEAILDAAEMVFAEAGFHGATTRAIADAAGTNVALIHYYFGTKDALFETVFTRRAGAINAERTTRLDALHAQGRPALEQVIDALLRPTVALGHDPERGGAHYARLVAHVAQGSDARSRRLTAAAYDAIAHRFIDEIGAAVPGLSREQAVHAYLHAIAIGIALMAPTGRARGLLAPAPAPSERLDTILARTVRFVAAGIRALDRPG